MKSIDDQIKSANPRTIKDLELLLKKISSFNTEILLGYSKGYYKGIKVMVKYTDKLSVLLPKGDVYNIPRGNGSLNKRAIFLKDKK